MASNTAVQEPLKAGRATCLLCGALPGRPCRFGCQAARLPETAATTAAMGLGQSLDGGEAVDSDPDGSQSDDSESSLPAENRRANGGCGCDGDEGGCMSAGDDAWTEDGQPMGHFLLVCVRAAAASCCPCDP